MTTKDFIMALLYAVFPPHQHASAVATPRSLCCPLLKACQDHRVRCWACWDSPSDRIVAHMLPEVGKDICLSGRIRNMFHHLGYETTYEIGIHIKF